MTFAISIDSAIEELACDPLRHIVLLKQLLAYPGHVKAWRASGAAGTAILLALDAVASAYDCEVYPEAAIVAFIASDDPGLTAALMPCCRTTSASFSSSRARRIYFRSKRNFR